MTLWLAALLALSARAAPIEAATVHAPAYLAPLILPASALGLGDLRWNAWAASLGPAPLNALGRGESEHRSVPPEQNKRRTMPAMNGWAWNSCGGWRR